MSKADLWFDCEGAAPAGEGWEELKQMRQRELGQVPLLLLYPIDHESPPTGNKGTRVSLNAVEDVLGLGIVFPGSVTEGGQFVSVDLPSLSTEDLERMEAEEAAEIAVIDAEEGRIVVGERS
ncbi:hypothetical protein [Ensifer sp. 1H6]|uniref:hypothetical protein n=1 Tax=Ensifer sp. 1H6 TaxID=1911585 RepID=UPI0018E9ED2C|nr:hypothetical protein [Ensifer sp. 1H6]